MTEKEAKKKICPVGRMRSGFDGNWDKGYCIGAACMAWRQTFGPHADRAQFLDRETMQPIEVDPGDGYCGLAGKP